MSPGHRRREAALRGSQCQRAAIAQGLHATLAVLCVLADYAAISADLPYPSQTTLATRCHRSVRAVRYQLAALEGAGLIDVYRSPARRGPGGRWTRSTNRYLLADRRAKAQVHLEATRFPSPLGVEARPARRGPVRAVVVTVLSQGPAPPTRMPAALLADAPPP